MLTRRQLDMLMKIMNVGKPLLGKELSKIFEVDVRTVRSDIKKINMYLEPYDIHIMASNKFGYMVEKADVEKFHNVNIFGVIQSDHSFEVPQTPNERISYLIFLLSQNNSYEIEDLADLLYVSTTCLYHDLHTLSQFITQKFKGVKLTCLKTGKYNIDGVEEAKRNMLSGIVAQRYDYLLEQKYNEYISSDADFLKILYRVVETIITFQSDFPFQFSGEGLYSFAADISLCLQREEKGLFLFHSIEQITYEMKTLKDLLCSHIPELEFLNLHNWCFLQERFYAKAFLVLPTHIQIEDMKLENIIEDFKKLVSEKYHIFILQDDKSVAYIIDFLKYVQYNDSHKFYWNCDDKNMVIENHVMCYLLALEFSYLVKKDSEFSFEKSSLATLALIIQDSISRNNVKKRAMLVTNKDKAHILHLLDKLVENFGTSINIVKTVSSFDIVYHQVDLNNIDFLISTQTDKFQVSPYCFKISSICNEHDIRQLRKSIDNTFSKGGSLDYQSQDIAILNQSTKMKPLLKECHEILKSHGVDIQNDFFDLELRETSFIQKGRGNLILFTPFAKMSKTTIFQLQLSKNVHYKQAEYSSVELFILNPKDIDQIEGYINKNSSFNAIR